jgi:hypothetical protein
VDHEIAKHRHEQKNLHAALGKYKKVFAGLVLPGKKFGKNEV